MRYLREWWPPILLGIATIGAYGTVYYSIGVLIPVIAGDRGWSTAALSGAFSLATVGQGAIALLAGRTFDRRGSRPVLWASLSTGAVFLLLASFAQTSAQFVAAWAIGGAAVGGGLFYNVTMPITARLYPRRRAAAFSVLTLLGALASPIFYPLAGWLTDAWGWRGALRGLVVLMALCVAPAAVWVNAPASSEPRGQLVARAGLLDALRDPVVYRALLVFALAGLATSGLLLHQVAAMQAAGLSLAFASALAGARGAFQIPGRLLLTPLTARFGVRGSMGLCYGFAATATLALMLAVGGAASLPLALYFVAVSGMALGLLSPLNGLFQAEVYGDARLGTLTGVGVVVGSLAAAAGASLAGALEEATGSYTLPLACIVGLQTLAIAALIWQGTAMRGGAREPVAIQKVPDSA